MSNITKEKILEELSKIAFANAADFVEVSLSEDGEMQIKAKKTKGLSRNKSAAIAYAKEGAKGVEIKLYDKMKALEMIGKYLGMFENEDSQNDGKLTEILKAVKNNMM